MIPESGVRQILASPLPPPPEGDVLTPAQWVTLLAIGDTVISSVESTPNPPSENLVLQQLDYASIMEKLLVTVPVGTDPDLPRQYLQENASSVPQLRASLHRMFGHYLRMDARNGIATILSALNTRAGCLLMTGSTTFFHQQTVQARQQILQNWECSYLPPLRQVAKALSLLFRSTWLKTSPTIGPILGFPKVPIHGKTGKGFNYEFLTFPPDSNAETIETDVVIVGSGCGGSVCAKNLSEAGHRVLVVEKAYHFPPEHLPMSEADAGTHLFMNGGVEVSDDSSISMIAGQAFGGGGTINWSASLQTQGFVRKEWASQGLPFFTSASYQDCLDRVCQRMGVSADHIEHNKTNRVILEGARKLGYSVKAVPQNTGGTQHYCGYCTLGCGSSEKQGPVVSYLPDAARAGAKFIEGFQADKILLDDAVGTRTAIGVKGTWRSRDSGGGVSGNDYHTREIIIKAKRVIVSCGTLQSPLLLIRSGLRNTNIGRHLKLHPVSMVAAVFDEEVRPWEGGILTAVCDEFQNLDNGHGTKIEALTMLPSWALTSLPWRGALEWKELVSKFKHMCMFISLVRDQGSGRVYPDSIDGKCRIAYTPSTQDKKHCLEGLIAISKMCYVAGAREIITATGGIPSFFRKDVPDGEFDPGINDAEFQAWLKLVRDTGLIPPAATFASAHQMGSCRMGSHEKTSVVNTDGKVWGVDGLYVADASIFPSASGVNPMITNMAISDWISRGIARDMSIVQKMENGRFS